jgi:hypothetical protein
MGAIQDVMALNDQDKIDAQAAAQTTGKYNADGSGVANDYHPPKVPTSTFPPHLAASGQFHVDRDQLSNVASQMQNDLAMLQNTLQTLYGSGVGGSTLGGWDTADAMGNNAGQAYYGISTFYQNLSTVYDQVIGYLHATVTNYADSEDASTAAARSVGSDASPSGSLA